MVPVGARRSATSRYRDWYVWPKRKPLERRHGGGLPRRAERRLDARRGGRRVVPPPLLPVPTRPQHRQPRGARRDRHASWGSGWSSASTGFRVDAVPFLLEMTGIPGTDGLDPHRHLKDLRAFVQRRKGDAILLGEVNLPPRRPARLLRRRGRRRAQPAVRLLGMQRFYLALARGDATPAGRGLDACRRFPSTRSGRRSCATTTS